MHYHNEVHDYGKRFMKNMPVIKQFVDIFQQINSALKQVSFPLQFGNFICRCPWQVVFLPDYSAKTDFSEGSC
jgi:hypothetical protein